MSMRARYIGIAVAMVAMLLVSLYLDGQYTRIQTMVWVAVGVALLIGRVR